VLFEPATLQRGLETDHIPAMVTAGSFCSSNPAPSGFSQVASIPVQPGQHRVKVTINPAAMPAGTKLSFGHFQLASSQQTSIALIDTGSYTCTGTAPTALPSGGGALLRYSGGACDEHLPVAALARARHQGNARPGPETAALSPRRLPARTGLAGLAWIQTFSVSRYSARPTGAD
jgi:hypothetical protein